MTEQLVWDLQVLQKGTTGWESQERLMDATAKDFRAASPGALPPSVQGAATAFFSTWAGLAGESTAIAQGFVGALKATGNDYSTSDDAADRQFSDLDGRLGPAR
ncbi:hypothetical protein EUA93_09820 [Nocardioides oleivorans]|uniref:WXG100 family type VII secretion target n=1 Tax=Nocardioides oleivorans TaxID=273676 RepID=A0A4Q2S3D2_9ACTN|nr:hypothetical protein [Nocardioides oleivorans]RYB94613.1 hypothetical protein EUA93_09820 [Nocardioides oleivorans]